MRPKKLYWPEQEKLLVSMYDKVRAQQKKEKNCNQFYIATRLKKLFDCEVNHELASKFALMDWNQILSLGSTYHDYHMERHKKEDENKNKLAVYFECEIWEIHNVEGYIYQATPAAIVQMVKRIKNRYKTR